MVDNVVLVVGVQQRDSLVHIYVSLLLKIFSRLGYYRVLNRVLPCYTVGPCWLSVVYIVAVLKN